MCFNFHFDRKEISLIRIRGFLVSSIYALFFSSSAMAGFISVTTLLFKDALLTSFQVFTLLTLLTNIKMVVTIFIADSLRYIADARTACRRIQNVIEKKSMLTHRMNHQGSSSILEVYSKNRKCKPPRRRLKQKCQGINPQVFLENITCVWSHTSELPTLDNVSLNANSGQLVGITGPVGSGKTSLLMTILGEIPISSGKISCIGKIAFVSQTPWVYSGTVRENIVFGKEFHEQKYTRVLEVCDLEKDIASFMKHDVTEIGQRGVILSGGQRARVSLARAIYSDADIYLLDDPLSAVDAKVGKHLFDRCIKEFLDGRMRILVTHQLQFLKETDSIVVLRNGSVVCEGTYSRIKKDKQVASCFVFEEKKDFDGEQNNDESFSVINKDSLKSMSSAIEHHNRVDLEDEAEDRMVGTVKWWLYWKYLRAALPTLLIVSLLVFFTLVQGKQ